MMSELQTQIETDIKASPVHVFMKGTPEWPQCGFSKAVCDVFRAVGTDFTATNVLTDLDSFRAALGSITQWPTIPQVFIDGEFVGGCDILIEMYHRGEPAGAVQRPEVGDLGLAQYVQPVAGEPIGEPGQNETGTRYLGIDDLAIHADLTGHHLELQ